jgi:aldehyde dehydrogenase (NAD+)
LLPKPIIRQDKYFPPTLIESASWDDLVMKEEIFGPILPILTFTKIEDVIQTLLTKEKPLALYLFSEHKATHQLVFEQLSFGNGAINDALMQVSSTYLPFGGVGQSGMGAYHGKHSFDTFSHFKSYIHKSTKFDFPFAYPPHNEAKMKLIKKFIK